MSDPFYVFCLAMLVFAGTVTIITIITDRIQEDIQQVLKVISHIERQSETIINQQNIFNLQINRIEQKLQEETT